MSAKESNAMLQKSKKILSLILCVLMCVSMLPVSMLSAAAETAGEAGSENVDAYAAINATLQSDGTYLPGSNAVFVYAGAPSSGETTYTYGDGETWGNGKTYKLTGGKNAFSKMNAAIHYVESQWNAYTGPYSQYTGPDTVVVAPGTYGGDSWQNNKQVIMNLPRDDNGVTIENPAYYELFTYTVLGPQAGKDPTPATKEARQNGTLSNGRSTNTATEAVSTSTMWMPQNAQLVVDGFAIRGSHNYYQTSAVKRCSLVLKNINHVYDAVYSKGLYRFGQGTSNVNLELHNYAMKYTQVAKASVADNCENFNLRVTRLVFDNYYEDGSQLQFVSDRYNQAHMLNIYLTASKNIMENFLGEGVTTAYMGVTDSCLNNNKTAHWARIRFTDVSHGDENTKAQIDINNNYFYNSGDYCATDGAYNSTTGKVEIDGVPSNPPKIIMDTISLRDAWKLPDNALTFNFVGNTIEYDAQTIARHPEGHVNGFIEINNSNDVTKQNFNLKNTTMILPEHSATGEIILSKNTKAFDRSSILCINDKGEVMAYARGADIANDVYAGDDFQGGVAEMFMLESGADMAIAKNFVKSTRTDIKSPSPVTADVLIVPYASEKTYEAKDLFTFRGEKVEFVTLTDAAGNELTEAKPSELNGAKMVATYKGINTVCNVTYNIKVATQDDMVFIDPDNTATSYNWNGKTYTLTDSNRVATFVDAVKSKKSVWVLLPGTHAFVDGDEDRIYDALQVAILGPKMGVSPLNEDQTINFTDRAITGDTVPYTVDTAQEAVVTGDAVVYSSQGWCTIDGVVADSNFRLSPSDAKESWGLATGSALTVFNVTNTIANGISNNNFTVGFGSTANDYITSKNKRAVQIFDSVMAATASSGLIISSGIYDIRFDNIYAFGGRKPIVLTRMPSGILMDLSPMACGVRVTNSKIEDWGTDTGNWFYTNYADVTTAKDWGRSAYCTGENFPAGIHQIFDNNTFINIGKAGCQTKGYALRLAIPSKMDNATITFTNNTVVEDELSTYRFIDTCGSAGMYLAEGNVNISGNEFINFTEPVRLSQNGDVTKRAVHSLDENYFATIVDGKEVVTPITADSDLYYVSKSDWYYMDKECTVKSSDFGLDLSALSNQVGYVGFPTWTIDAKFFCGISAFNAEDIKGTGDTTIAGIYKDADCTQQLTDNISENTFYVKAKIKDAEQVITVNAAKSAQHSFGEYVTTLAPVCGVEGEAKRTCTTCGTEETKVLAALKHVESEPTYTAATCTEPAGIYVTCLICGETISGTQIEGSELGHDWTEWETTTEGSCTIDTVKERTCKRTDCGEKETETTTAPGHSFSDWTVVIEPTCEAAGLQSRTCSTCTSVETLPVAATGHTYETVTTDPTCVAEGKEEAVCKVCGQVDKSQTVVLPATGEHTWGNYIVKDATCTQPGISERFCTVCNAVDEDTRSTTPKDPDNHGYDADGKDWVVVDEGDCLSPVVSERTCPDCGAVETAEDYTNVTGYHNYKLVTTPASYDQTGKQEKICTECGDTVFVKLLARLPKFSDVDSKAWYADYMSKAAALGLLKGYEDGTVRPNSYITRAEAVTMFARLAGVNTAKYSTAKFTDVAKKAWYNGAIAWAEQNKIVSGRTETTFDPNGNINRQELCTILVRYTKFAGIELNMEVAKAVFADDAKIAKYAKSSVYLCQRAGIVSGRPGNLFAPTAYATRAEVAKILVTFIEDYDLANNTEAAAKAVDIETENARYSVAVKPLNATIKANTTKIDALLKATGTDAADLKDATSYEDSIVAKEYELSNLKLANADAAKIAALEAELQTLYKLKEAADLQAELEDAQAELAAENKLHAANLAAIEKAYK